MTDDPRIDVLIVDDSAVVRTTLRSLLAPDPIIGTVETAADPYIAAEKLRRFMPDVVILDIEMPRMDGLTFLRKLMAQHPLPVVMCSAHVGEGSRHAIEALENGAVELITKPRVGARGFLEDSRERVLRAVKAAAGAHVERRPAPRPMTAKLKADVVLPKPLPRAGVSQNVVVIGASTGGVEALHRILEPLPGDLPPIVVVQHMPEHFTRALADRLNDTCRLHVREAHHGDRLEPGLCLIAPGNRHVAVRADANGCRVELIDGEPVNRHKPSVDVLFRSAAALGPKALGILLTGMGDDGASGLLEMRQAGAHTIAQDEASCVVFGMPAVAIERGGADEVLPLSEIAPRLTTFVTQ